MAGKKSFFEKLTGSMRFNSDDQYTETHEEEYLSEPASTPSEDTEGSYTEDQPYDEIGELSVDMYRVNDAIIIKTMVAGISKSEIDITLSRDTVTIEGSRKNDPEGSINEVYFNELYWGAFERTIDLPEEIDIELAEANESHGLLTLVLPLVDRYRQTRVKIK
jgi:HSP20 family molecular chaperone IbpA